MKRIVLDNGLRIISLKKPKDYTTRIAIGINYGPSYETKKLCAIPHSLEHMIFRDTKKHTYEQIIEKISSCGGFTNGLTRDEDLIFIGYSPSKNFKYILNPFLELVLEPSFKLKDFKKEKDIILNEIFERIDSPYTHR